MEVLRKQDPYCAEDAELTPRVSRGMQPLVRDPQILRRRKTNAARTSHPSRIVRGSLVLPSRRLGRRDDGTDPTTLTLLMSATFTGTVADA